MAQRRATELTWVFRPTEARPTEIRALTGARVHATGPVGADGTTEVVLADGTRVRATPTEIVAEQDSPTSGPTRRSATMRRQVPTERRRAYHR